MTTQKNRIAGQMAIGLLTLALLLGALGYGYGRLLQAQQQQAAISHFSHAL